MNRTANIADELAAAEIRAALQGKRCWHAYVGIGCTFAMDLGKKILRDSQERAWSEKHARNYPPEYRRYEGESHLLVWCSWRIEDGKGPLASSDNDFDVCEQAIRRLIGRAVREVRIGPGWDLRVEMSSGLTVTVFADHVGAKAIFDGNWELWRPDQAYLIGTNLACEVIDRQNRALSLQPRGGRWVVAPPGKGKQPSRPKAGAGSGR